MRKQDFFLKSPFLDAEMTPYERNRLYTWIIENMPKCVFEVGTGLGGGSTYYIAEAFKDIGSGKIYTCDPGRHPSNSFLDQYKDIVFYHQKSSQWLIDHLINEQIIPDFLMFDGPEDPTIALEDIIKLEKIIKTGTLFCMHDWEFEKRGYDNGISTKSKLIRPYIENSKKYVQVEILSGLRKNSNYDTSNYDSVGLCLYKFIG